MEIRITGWDRISRLPAALKQLEADMGEALPSIHRDIAGAVSKAWDASIPGRDKGETSIATTGAGYDSTLTLTKTLPRQEQRRQRERDRSHRQSAVALAGVSVEQLDPRTQVSTRFMPETLVDMSGVQSASGELSATPALADTVGTSNVSLDMPDLSNQVPAILKNRLQSVLTRFVNG